MRWVDISIGKRLYITFAAGVMVVVAIAVLVILDLNSIENKVKIIAKPRQDTMLLTAEVAHLQWAINVGDYILNEGKKPLTAAVDGRQCAFGKWFYGDGRKQMEDESAALRPVFQDIDGSHLALHKSAATIREAIEAGEFQKAEDIFATVSKPILAQVQQQLATARETVNKDYSSHVDELGSMVSIAQRALLITVLVVVIGAVVLVFLVVRSIINPLRTLTNVAASLAQGNFVPVPIVQKDEVGDLANAFVTMSAVIKEKLGFAEGIMRGIATPFAVCDTQGRMVFLNDAMLECWGRTGKPSDYYGKTSGAFFYNEPGKATTLTAVLQDKTPLVRYNLTRKNLQGEEKYLVLDVFPLLNMDNELMGAFTLHEDVTPAHEQQERIAALNERIYHSAQEARQISQRQTHAFDELSHRLETTAHLAGAQARDSADVATTLREMSDSLRLMAHKANATLENAQGVRNEADKGADVVRETIQCINEVAAQTGRMAERMNELDNHAADIGRILELIKDIADQTNLLALNAAIEAARAGDAGRGFAVVADEVRKLAEKTMQATGEVSRAVLAIQGGVRVNVVDAQEAAGLTQKSAVLAHDSGTKLERIRDVIRQSVDEARAITTATVQQSEASNTALEMMNNFSSQASRTTESMEESMTRAEELRALADELKRIIDSMRDERRTTVRFDMRTPVALRWQLPNGTSGNAQLLDVSRTGVRVMMPEICLWNQDDPLRIVNVGGILSTLLAQRPVKVRWADGHQVGLTFIEMLTVNLGEILDGKTE